MLRLRSYQQALLGQLQDTLDDNTARVMLQLPTGAGKTVIAGALLADRLADGRRAAWLTHRKELAEQTRGMLTDAGISAITNVNWTPGEDAPAMAGGAVILMAQTVSRRNVRRQTWGRYHAADLLVIDEAHHAAAPGWERAMRQWPGPVVGLTATPWRLSEQEGFDHLFDELICGPQVAELQQLGALCHSQALLPPPEQRIAGGAVDHTGDYSDAGIMQANAAHPDIMTAGALEFWRQHAGDRQTIAYAVSVEHAHNLASVFNDAGSPAAVLLGHTGREERDAAIAGFREGSVRVLVNVLVATEGFDLPDASCIIIARPTLSLALYLQMVGRGLRPKTDGGDCLIIDLAANSVTHGLPEDYREWSLQPRGKRGAGDAPVMWCEKCFTASHAASHNCGRCGAPFGKNCERCGKWRAWKRWQYETHCGDAHQLVCDLCHIDAHIQAHLPVAPPLDGLVDLYDPEDSMTTGGNFEIDDDLASRLSALYQELLDAERQVIAGADDARRAELRRLIAEREDVLDDNVRQYALFQEHIATLPESGRPADPIHQGLMIAEYVGGLRSELAGWRSESAELGSKPIDKAMIFSSAQNKAMHLLRREAQAADLLEPNPSSSQVPASPLATNRPGGANGRPTPINSDGGRWVPLPEFEPDWRDRPAPPQALRFRAYEVVPITRWNDVLVEVANWLIRVGKLSANDCPFTIGNGRSYLINTTPHNRDGRKIKNTRSLANGMHINVAYNSSNMVKLSRDLLQTLGEDPMVCEVLPKFGTAVVDEAVLQYQQPTLPSDDGGAWLPLSELSPNWRDKPDPPETLRFPGGNTAPLRGWYDILVTVAQWLVSEGKLLPSDCPVTLGNARRCLINTTPTYLNGNAMRMPRLLSNGTFIDANYDSTLLVRHSKALLQIFGADPAQFHVQPL